MKVNKMIDHTLLKQNATEEMIDILCNEAKEHDFASVCVNPVYVARSAANLKDCDVMVCTVVGFPLGNTTTACKEFETKDAIANGADEIDMVINVGHVKSNRFDLVEKDIEAVVNAANGKTVKVILETCLLENDEIKKLCEISVKVGAHFVKTSTGFSTGGATIEVVKLMKDTVGDKAEVKASGGVRSAQDAEAMIEAGATRIGTSGGVAIVNGLVSDKNY